MSDAKLNPSTNPVPPAGAEGSFSLEDLDKMIEVEDPGFKDSLKSIESDRINDDTSIESLDVEVEVGTEDVTQKEATSKKLITKLLSPAKKVMSWLHLHRISLTNRTKLLVTQSIHFFKNDFPDLVRYAISQLKVGIGYVKGWIRSFSALPRSKKALLGGAGLTGFLALFFLVKALSGEWLPMWRNPLILSLSDKSGKVYSVKSEDMIPFFDAFPEVEFQLLLSKMIVNLTPSASIPNPMGAFEFYLGLDSNETAIEIKDREKEILDLTQRTIEEFTYEEVMNPTSQLRIKARIRDNINQILNQGRVQKVYVKTLITYRQ